MGNDDGQDFDTWVGVTLYAGIGTNATAIASFVDNGTKYFDGVKILRKMNITSNLTHDEYIRKNRGSISLHIEPNGNDTWRFRHLVYH